MKTKKAHNKALKHILCCLIILIIFVLTIGVKADTITGNDTSINNETEEPVPLKPLIGENIKDINNIEYNKEIDGVLYDSPRIIEKDINYYILENESTLKFFSNTFGFDYEFITSDLINRSIGIKNIEPTNIGSLKNKDDEIKTFDNIEYGIVEYFYDLVEKNSKKINKKIIPCSKDANYVEKLIMYYTSIYTNVNTVDALSIGAAESGYYKVKYMLHQNNIYGGMSSRGLIRHENIEIGVLRYIRMLSINYYAKGLSSLESIGRIYCPTTNSNGIRIASPHWINLVNTAKSYYKDKIQNIIVDDLVNY